MASQFSEQIVEAFTSIGGVLCPSATVDIDSPPALTCVTDPATGGALSFELPGTDAGWNLDFAGYLHLPSPIGHRAFRVTVSKLRLTATVKLDPPEGSDTRPRIKDASSVTADVTGNISIWLEGFDTVASLELGTTGSHLLKVSKPIEILGITFPIDIYVTQPSEDGGIDLDLAVGPIRYTNRFVLQGPIAAKLADGLPAYWPRPGVDQPATPTPEGVGALSLEELRKEAELSRAAVLAQHQVMGVLFDTFSDGEVVGICGDEDSAIWTGHLLAADALNGDTTRTNETLTGVERLVDVPSRFAATKSRLPNDVRIRKLFPRDLLEADGIFARCALPATDAKRVYMPYGQPEPADQSLRPPEDRGEEFHSKELDYYRDVDAKPREQDRAHGRAGHPPTRDQLMGLMLGLACVLRFSSDETAKARASALAVRIARRLDQDGWTFLTPVGDITQVAPIRPCSARDTLILHHSMQLAVMRVAATADREQFSARYAELANAYRETLWIMPWIDTLDPLASLYPVNLQHAAYAILMLLEPDENLRNRYSQIGEILDSATVRHGNVHFDLLRLLASGDAAPLDRPPHNPAPYFGASTLEEGMRIALSDALTRREDETSLPRQANPSPEHQRYLLEKKDDDRFFDEQEGQRRALFAVPVSRRPGGNLDFAWQSTPFVKLVNGAYRKDRASVTSPGLDFILPTAVLGKLKSGVGRPTTSQISSPAPPVPPPPMGAQPFLTAEAKNKLTSIVRDVVKLREFLERLHKTGSMREFLNSRFRNYDEAALQQVITSEYGSSTKGATDHSVLIADAISFLGGRDEGAEFLLLKALRPALVQIWGAVGPAFRPVRDAKLESRRAAELLQRPVAWVLPGLAASALSDELMAFSALDPIREDAGFFTDPQSSFGLALRGILLTGVLR
jgi:hypothetical protein